MKKEEILSNLEFDITDIVLLDSVTSTNDYLKKLALNGAKDGTIVIAKSQTKGKGTKGRTFISKEGGLYLSILLKPDFRAFDATLITPLTAVAVSETIAQISGNTPQIKWVNDVYLEDKKVAGILCESSIDSAGKTAYLIVGIGVNLIKPKGGFDDEICDIATAVFEEENTEIFSQFVSALINNFYNFYAQIDNKTFLEKYRRQNFVLGKEVLVLNNNQTLTAKAVWIDDNCRLVVELPDKSLKTLSSGEVILKND
ncbi:MAG: biotin--[Clostridia bacterium]|nr:biotin--[acetyl-CoA-carboxylase] ligase [Clostridia bacterium]